MPVKVPAGGVVIRDAATFLAWLLYHDNARWHARLLRAAAGDLGKRDTAAAIAHAEKTLRARMHVAEYYYGRRDSGGDMKDVTIAGYTAWTGRALPAKANYRDATSDYRREIVEPGRVVLHMAVAVRAVAVARRGIVGQGTLTIEMDGFAQTLLDDTKWVPRAVSEARQLRAAWRLDRRRALSKVSPLDRRERWAHGKDQRRPGRAFRSERNASPPALAKAMRGVGWNDPAPFTAYASAKPERMLRLAKIPPP
jgi:hypothetical protein